MAKKTKKPGRKSQPVKIEDSFENAMKRLVRAPRPANKKATSQSADNAKHGPEVGR